MPSGSVLACCAHFFLYRDDFDAAFLLAFLLGFFLFRFSIFYCLVISMISGEGLGQVRSLCFSGMSGLHFVNSSTCFISHMHGGSRTTRPDNIVIIFPSHSSGVRCTTFLLLFVGSKLSNRKSESATYCFYNVVGKEEQNLNTCILLFCPIYSVLLNKFNNLW